MRQHLHFFCFLGFLPPNAKPARSVLMVTVETLVPDVDAAVIKVSSSPPGTSSCATFLLLFYLFYLICNFRRFAAFPFDGVPHSFVLPAHEVTIIDPVVADLFPIRFD